MTRRALALSLSSAAAALAIGSRPDAPKFRATSLDGERLDNSSLKGRPVLIQLWATWCGVCRHDEPVVDSVTAEFAPRGLIVVAVSVGESRRKVAAYLRNSPRKCKIVLTADTNLTALYGGKGVPFYLMLDPDGKIAGEQLGSTGELGLRQLVGKAISLPAA